MSLQADQRERDYNYERQITQMGFKIAQLRRFIGTDLLSV